MIHIIFINDMEQDIALTTGTNKAQQFFFKNNSGDIPAF